MKKILLISLASALPLTTLCNQANSLLKSQSLLNGKWIENEKIEEDKLFAPQLLKNKTNIYNNKQIEIDLIKHQSNKSIAMINAKKNEKKYYLWLQNDHFYNQEQLQNFIRAKFYKEKTSERFIPAERFYSFLDTKDSNGEITQNGTIEFRSSWGVYNYQEVESSIEFDLKRGVIEEFIYLHDRNNLPKSINIKNIEVEKMRPKKIGLLPLVQIHQPPIRNATWETTKITFNDLNNYRKYPYQKQDLKMPEGHDSGLEWWKGITSSIGVIGAIVSSVVSTFIGGPFWAKIIFGALIGGTSHIVGSLGDKFSENSIKDGVTAIKKIYEIIMENQINLSTNEVDFSELQTSCLSAFVEGKLWARANATSIWGITSKMNLFGVWGAVNSDILYRVYN